MLTLFTKPKIKTDQWWLSLLLSSKERGRGAPAELAPARLGSPALGLRCGGRKPPLQSAGARGCCAIARAFVTAPWGRETFQREFLKCFPALPGRSTALSHVQVGSRTDTELGQREPRRARRGARGLAGRAARWPPGDGGCSPGLNPPAAPPRPGRPADYPPACHPGTTGH